LPPVGPWEREAEPYDPAHPAPAPPSRSGALWLLGPAGNGAVTRLVARTDDRTGDRTDDRAHTDPGTLEREADRVAREHAAPLVRSHGWFGRPGGLDARTVAAAVGRRLDADLGDVDVRSGRLPGAPADALASAVDRTVHVAPGAVDAATPLGQALLAHELAHVVQQSTDTALPGGPRAEHADRRRSVGSAPRGMAQHTVACSGDSRAPATATTFADVAAAFRSSADPAVRAAALDRGIATARANAARMHRASGSPPVSTLRARYEAETSTTVSYRQPFLGVSQDDVETAYRAWAQNPGSSEPPWVLLAVWVKEGIAEKTPQEESPTGIRADSPDDARGIYRARAYFMNFGADVYIAHTAVAGADNDASFLPGTGAAHTTAFRAQVARQVAAGRLPRDVSGEIDAALSVTAAPAAGRFVVTPAPAFAVLTLMLVDAFYREQSEGLARDPRVGANPDPGLVYMRWNMRASSFSSFLDRTPNADPDGTTPARETWAFHRPIVDSEYGQSRRNAMRFKYLLEVFRHAYEDRP